MTAVKDTKVLKVGKITLNVDCHEVRAGDRLVYISRRQWQCLQILMESPGRLLDRAAFLGTFARSKTSADTRTVDQHICRLRDKLGAAGKQIQTVQSFGYKLVAK